MRDDDLGKWAGCKAQGMNLSFEEEEENEERNSNKNNANNANNENNENNKNENEERTAWQRNEQNEPML